MRGIPIFTFINKLDRQGKDPLALLEELEAVLGIRSCPMNWPIGMCQEFVGVFNRADNTIERYTGKTDEAIRIPADNLDAPEIRDLLGDDLHNRLKDEVMLLDIAGDPFHADLISHGNSPPSSSGAPSPTSASRRS